MYINASFDFAAGATQSDISQFQNAVNIVVGYFESVFTNVNVTLNVKFAYGEKYAGNPGGSANHLYADGQCNEHRHFRSRREHGAVHFLQLYDRTKPAADRERYASVVSLLYPADHFTVPQQ